MGEAGRRATAVALTLMGLTVGACSDAGSAPRVSAATSSPPSAPTSSSSAPAPASPPVAPDPAMQRLAARFVDYALGEAASFPHGGSVSLSIGGEPAGHLDDADIALPGRDGWSTCPRDWDGYAAASCPVDLLGPITTSASNGASLSYEALPGEVVCAPVRTGPLPAGRYVVIRPAPEVRDCARDFAITLVADARGRVDAVDLVLSDP